MGPKVIEDEPIAYEPMPVPDTFVTGTLPIEDVGELLRVTFYVDTKDRQGSVDRRIVSRLILSRAALVSLAGRSRPSASLLDDAAGLH